MKRTNKLWLASFLVLLVALLVAVGLTAAAEETPDIVASGYCGADDDAYPNGTNLTWTLTEDGVLTVSGTGDMHNYSWYPDWRNAPWTEFLADIRTVAVEDGVTGIGSDAFFRAPALESVTLPDGIERIGTSAFYQCAALTDANLPGTVTSIGSYAFAYDPVLENIVLPDGLTELGDYAFYRCVSLKEMTVPGSVTDFGNYVFSKCTGLERVTVEEGLTDMGTYTFEDCTALKEASVFAKLKFLTSMNVTFRNCTALTHVTLGEGMEGIGYNAFQNCTALTSITIPASATSIASDAFSGCTSLKNVVLQEGFQGIHSRAFTGCTALEQIQFPETLLGIGDNAFAGCTALKNVMIPKNVGSYDSTAFAGCTALRAITVDEENPRFQSTSDGCVLDKRMSYFVSFPSGSPLTDYTVPDGMVRISFGAFMGSSSLKNVVLPDSVEVIERKAFFDCTALESVTMGKGLMVCYGPVFNGCTALKALSVDPENPYYRSVENCVIKTNEKRLVFACKTSKIPEDGSVLYLEEYAFASTPEAITVPAGFRGFGQHIYAACTELKTVVLAPGITRTGVGMFPRSVEKIVIPDTVTYIDTCLCFNYDNLEIYYTGSEEQWNQITISNSAESYPNQNIVDAPKHFNYQFRQVDAVPSTCREQGFSAGLFCDVTDTWVSGHEALPLADHTWSGWTVTQQPTTDRTGTETRTCSVCGETETRSIDKLPQPDNGGNDNNSDDDDGGFFGWIQRAMKGLVDWFKKLLSFLRK